MTVAVGNTCNEWSKSSGLPSAQSHLYLFLSSTGAPTAFLGHLYCRHGWVKKGLIFAIFMDMRYRPWMSSFWFTMIIHHHNLEVEYLGNLNCEFPHHCHCIGWEQRVGPNHDRFLFSFMCNGFEFPLISPQWQYGTVAIKFGMLVKKCVNLVTRDHVFDEIYLPKPDGPKSWKICRFHAHSMPWNVLLETNNHNMAL